MVDATDKRGQTKPAMNASLATRFHGLVFAVLIAITVVGFFRIPTGFAFPAHWGEHGVADWLWPRDTALTVGPAAALIILAGFAGVHRLLSKTRVEMIRHNAEPAMTGILMLFCAVQFALVLIGVGSDFDLMRIIACIVAPAFFVLGVVTAEAERHTYAGVRLPWPIASQEQWKLAHRIAGALWIVSGITIAALAWLQPDIGTLIAAFPIAIIAPFLTAAIVSRVQR